MATSQVQSVLENEITCALCLDIFKEPKKLPCDHVFCKTCLEMLARNVAQTTVPCPECRKPAQIPNGRDGVKDLPTAFHVNRLIDAFQLMRAQERDANRGTEASRTAQTSASTIRPTFSDDDWVELSRDDLSRSVSSPSEWQRMKGIRERERLRENAKPRRDSHNERQAKYTFSQFFSQLKEEMKIIVDGVKGGIEQVRGRTRSHSQEPRLPNSRPIRQQSAITTQSHARHYNGATGTDSVVNVSQGPSVPDNTKVVDLLKDKNQEIVQLYQQLQLKSHQEQQHKQNVARLEREKKELSDRRVALEQQRDMEHLRRDSMMKEQVKREHIKSKQLEMEMETLKRQCQDLSIHQPEQAGSYQSSQQHRKCPPTLVMQLPNTLSYRVIARHPHVSRKLIEYAKSHGVEICFTEGESDLQMAIYGSSESVGGIQTELSSLDHKVQAILETRYEQMHCAVLPLLLEPHVLKSLAEIEMKFHVEICIADNSGTVAPLEKFVQLLQSVCTQSGTLLTTSDVKNISVPDVHIMINYNWKICGDNGSELALPMPVNHYLNRAFFVEENNEAKFEFNGRNYTANLSLMQITEIETGIQMALDLDPVAPLWSYAISDSDYVVHESHDSANLENMFRYGGSSIALAGSKNTLDLTAMHQIDLTTGHIVAVKRCPTLKHHQPPQYFITFAIRGLQKSLRPASRVIKRTFSAFCTTVNFTSELLPSVPQNWRDIILLQMLNTARQYCLRIDHNSLERTKISIQMKGSKAILHEVQIQLKEQSLELQHRVISQQKPPPSPPQDNYPQEWEPQNQDFKLLQVHHRSSEWKSVEGLTKISLANISVFNVHRIQNRQLWDKYALEKQHMSKRNNGSVNERRLFHGTRNTDPKVIIEGVRGIDFRYSRRDYQLRWGTGAYFALNASYSDKYCYVDSNTGMKQLLLVKVLTGKSCSYGKRNDPNLTKPPPLSQGCPVLYDTVNGYTNGSYVYVVYDHDRAYPAYLITYFDSI